MTGAAQLARLPQRLRSRLRVSGGTRRAVSCLNLEAGKVDEVEMGDLRDAMSATGLLLAKMRQQRAREIEAKKGSLLKGREWKRKKGVKSDAR